VLGAAEAAKVALPEDLVDEEAIELALLVARDDVAVFEPAAEASMAARKPAPPAPTTKTSCSNV